LKNGRILVLKKEYAMQHEILSAVVLFLLIFILAIQIQVSALNRKTEENEKKIRKMEVSEKNVKKID
jgi:hypothetical protein